MQHEVQLARDSRTQTGGYERMERMADIDCKGHDWTVLPLDKYPTKMRTARRVNLRSRNIQSMATLAPFRFLTMVSTTVQARNG